MGIIEIILTIFAWRKGWRWWALLPTVVAISIGFFIGLSINANGGTVDSLGSGTIFIDVAAVIALIIMLCITPKSKIAADLEKAAEAKKAAETPKSV